jgi:hypothetical protein
MITAQIEETHLNLFSVFHYTFSRRGPKKKSLVQTGVFFFLNIFSFGGFNRSPTPAFRGRTNLAQKYGAQTQACIQGLPGRVRYAINCTENGLQ